MKPFFLTIALSVFLVCCFCAATSTCFAAENQSSSLVAQADPSASVKVTNCKLKTDGSVTNNLVVEAYVENASDKCANDITVNLVFRDNSGVSGGDLADGKPRVYSYYTASVPQIKPHSGQWVTIPTTVANPTNINEGARTVTIEIWRKGEMSATPIVLQYYFMTKTARFTD